jgi:acyl-CoA reductase-like NAD-dependent aldehyde dehydrogenase
MKTPIMLACALVLATVLNGRTQEKAATPATPAVPAAPAAVEKDANAGKGKGAKLTPEQREAMVTKRLEQIKAKDEALYKECSNSKRKTPRHSETKMRERAGARAKARARATPKVSSPAKAKAGAKARASPKPSKIRRTRSG